MVDSVERDWVEILLHIVARQVVVFLRPGFAQHPTNCLLVYDNRQPVVGLVEQLVTAWFDRKLSGSRWSFPFCKLLVQKSHMITQFSDGSRYFGHCIPESWLDRW